MISYKTVKIILQALLLSVIAIIPFIQINELYFPFVSGKVYGFRLLVCLAFFFWVWLLLKKDPKKPETMAISPYRNILVASLAIFFLVQIVVSIFGISPALSFFSSIERQDGVIQYGFWVLYFLMLLFAFKNKQDWKILFSVSIITAFLVSCYSWLNLANQGRLAGFFGNPSYLAAYLLFATGFCFISIERKFFENKLINILPWILSLFFAVTLFYTQTRGAYLGLAGAVFLFCLLAVLFLRSQSKKIVIYSAIILAIGIISVAGLFFIKDTNFVKDSPLLSRMTEITQFWEIGSIRERILTWQIALKAFTEKPVFGYGPENFMVAFNKHYDFRVGRGDPWFDHTHNQFFEYLATGGIVLIIFYILLLFFIFYVIFKIAKKEKALSFILASVFLAYIIQGLFLFDTLAVYLGLFPFLAFIAVVSQQTLISADKKQINVDVKNKWQTPVLVITALVCLFGIQTAVILPYTASASAIQFLIGTNQGYYKEVIPFIQKAFDIKSPYTYWELRKRAGWQFLNVIDGDKKLTEQEVADLGNIYDIVVPELERFSIAMPSDPQIYYVLSRIYRLGYQKLGKNDLEKAKTLLEAGFTYSDTRIEYYNEMGQVLLLEGKFSDGEKLLKDYANRMKPISFDYFSSWLMGNYYYVAGKYDLAMKSYIMAKEAGYDFTENDREYSRYIEVADKSKNYQEIVDMSIIHIERRGPKADVYFNVALGYYYLGDKIKAKEFFQKAVELDKEQYQQYESFFVR
ncbi:MAG: O-antigen ligase family protein [Candidatus Staskawiczbacteria bacterium]|jgi:O-antigen ligase